MNASIDADQPVLFITGAHIDLTGRMKHEPVPAVSNPGIVSQQPGGAGLNMASTAAVLGVNTILASPVGADAFGALLAETVEGRGIGNGLFEVPGEATGTYTAITAPDGQLVIGLANLEIYERVSAGTLFTHCGSAFEEAGVWCLNTNPGEACLREIVARCKNYDTTKMLCAATVSPAKAPRLRPILSSLDIVFTNVSEARALSGLQNGASDALANWFASAGVKSGIISAQAEPLTWWHEGKTGRLQPPTVTQIKDVNGAGDALGSTVLAAIIRGEEFENAVRLGMAAGQMTIAVSQPFNPALNWRALAEAAEAIETTGNSA